ncbi:phosphopantetheine-binding protein [Nocardia sp. NPDC004168]|uniref:phosphopantetheine-binding protein n=1 Tax=Nocardia sp. NPDC004168 TaxID=3154452 RepID=UPI0033AC7DF8
MRTWSEEYENLLRRHVTAVAAEESLRAEAPFGDLGIDSPSIISLLVEAEEIFEITIPDDELNGETFHSPLSFWRVIDRLRRADSA